MFDPESKRVTSPIYNLLVYLNEYDEVSLNNKKLQFLLKNISTHFKKIIYSIALINKFQEDESFINKYNNTEIVSIQLIEYCFYKISTIWDISYQIAELLVLPKIKGNKYDYLSNQFKLYSDQLPNLETNWYENFNKIRNRITHGGITVNSCYINDEIIKNRICFQAYNIDLDDLVECDPHFTNSNNNNINFADNFFAYHTHLLYSYLTDFFRFVLLEMTKDKEINIDDIKISNDFTGQFEKSHKTWLLSDINTFTEITNNMILLRHTNGNIHAIQHMQNQQMEAIINQAYNKFPFAFMRGISHGDWIVDNSQQR